jgi:hypothetical protein
MTIIVLSLEEVRMELEYTPLSKKNIYPNLISRCCWKKFSPRYFGIEKLTLTGPAHTISQHTMVHKQ